MIFKLPRYFILGFLLCACSQSEEKSGRAIYNIPFEFQPDTGIPNPLTRSRKINSTEFAFTLTESHLEKAIEGFQAGLDGRVQNIYVIVNVYEPKIHDDWKPLPHQVKVWDDMWTMSGKNKDACIADEPDEYTGFYRYHSYCSAEPDLKSAFFLVDRIPDASKPRPPNQEYLKGHCSFREDHILKRGILIQNCRFKRRTKWGDRFSFRLRSENLYLLEEVESYIAGLLTEWKR